MCEKRNILILTLAVLAYFISYPDDLEAVVAPIITILNLTTAVSPSFYGVVAVAILAFAVIRTWGHRAGT